MIESEGYDAEEVDRRIAADRARETELGAELLPARVAAGERASATDAEHRERPNQTEEQAA